MNEPFVVTGHDLCLAWRRYIELFGAVPHGSEKQMAALLDLVPNRLSAKQWEERYGAAPVGGSE